MVPFIAGLATIAQLVTGLKGIRDTQQINETVERILAEIKRVQAETSQAHLSIMRAIEKQADHAEIKRLVQDLFEALGDREKEAEVGLEVLQRGQEGAMQPCFHRRVNHRGKRGTDGLRITGTAFFFDLRLRNDGEKQTSVEEIWIDADVGNDRWHVTEHCPGSVDGVKSSMGCTECFRDGQILTIPARGYFQTRIQLVTDRCVPDGQREIKAAVHCKPRWGRSGTAACVLMRSHE